MIEEHATDKATGWSLRETALDLSMLAQRESLFALSNGHLGLRGNLDEGEPFGTPGTYLNGFYEVRPLPSAEPAYGNPEAGQAVVNVTNGKLMRLLVDDEPFDVRYGELTEHQRELDLRAGVLRRTVEWTSPAGQAVRIRSVRLVSLVQRAVAAICYEVEPLGADARLVVQSELVANEPQSHTSDGDPRAQTALNSPLVSEFSQSHDRRIILAHHTRGSGLRMAAAADHIVAGPDGTGLEIENDDDVARVTVTSLLQPGEKLRIVKFLSYGWSRERSTAALTAQVAAAVSEARQTGWDALLAAQREYLDAFWARSEVEVEGDDELQLAVRVAQFHVVQAGARAEGRAIPAKGLTGSGYDGHAFWDTESYVLPVLSSTIPHAAADALRWRHSTLPLARDRARQLGLEGAAFPWRTIHGEECSGYWPAGTGAFHVSGDIAHAVMRLHEIAPDMDFMRDVGLELLVETARLWASLGHLNEHGFNIDGVTGPDEYSAVADNNVYTNLLAQRNLRAAAAASEHMSDAATAFGVDEEEIARWRQYADAVVLPFHEGLGVHEQSANFCRHGVWDFAATGAEHYPLLLHYPYFDLYRKQVVKQADLVLAMFAFPQAFTAEQKLRNFDYYESLTVRDSSLSASIQSAVAAEVGHTQLAYDYLREAALLDLRDIEHNTSDGMHIAALAGTWIAIVAGLGGMRHEGGALTFAPCLPEPLTRLAFRVSFQSRQLAVQIRRGEATYTLVDGEPLDARHYGDAITLTVDEPVVRPIVEAPARPRPVQPPGREPITLRADR